MTIYEQRAEEAFAVLIKDEPDLAEIGIGLPELDEALKELVKGIFKTGWLAGLQYADPWAVRPDQGRYLKEGLEHLAQLGILPIERTQIHVKKG